MRFPLTMLALCLAVGCAPADVAGDYTVNVRNGPNECGFDNWTEGDTASSIPVEITQLDSDVTIDVMGATGLGLDLAAADDLAEIAAGWRGWIDEPAGFFACPNGQIIGRTP